MTAPEALLLLSGAARAFEPADLLPPDQDVRGEDPCPEEPCATPR